MGLFSFLFKRKKVSDKPINSSQKKNSHNINESNIKTNKNDSGEISSLRAELSGFYPSYISSVKFKVEKNKRINLKTGHPLSTNKQIINSYRNATIRYAKASTWEDKQLDYILPLYNRGDLFYKLGEWEKAEAEWFQLVYLMPHAINKLSIMYRKEKRYKDVVKITEEASKSTIMPKLYDPISSEDVAIAEADYEKHVKVDKSILSSDSFKALRGYVK